jgi:hypothetical protein
LAPLAPLAPLASLAPLVPLVPLVPLARGKSTKLLYLKKNIFYKSLII